MLHRTVRASGVRLHNIAMHRHAIMLGCRYFEHVSRHILTEYGKHRRHQFALAVRRKNLLAIPDQAECNFRMGKCRMLHNAKNITCLCEILFEKFHARGRVEKQVAHHHGRALRAACFLLHLNVTRFEVQMQSRNRAFFTGEQINPRNRRNRSERLTAETQRTDCCKVLLRTQLTGRMAAECHRRILLRHAAAIVCNA